MKTPLPPVKWSALHTDEEISKIPNEYLEELEYIVCGNKKLVYVPHDKLPYDKSILYPPKHDGEKAV